MVELEFKADILLEDGKHEGTITRLEFRETPFRYTDIFVKEKKAGAEIKVGFPTTASQRSGLGKLLLKFDNKIKVGEKVDPEKILVGRECYFHTTTQTGDDGGQFTHIIKHTIKAKLLQEELPDDPE